MQPKIRTVYILCSVCLSLALAVLASCANLTPMEVKQEVDHYYGVGSGATRDEAEAAAKLDLISNALTQTARSQGSGRGRVQINAEAAASFELPKLRRVARDDAGGGETVMLSIEWEQWDEAERAREAALRAELQERFSALKQERSQPLADRIREAARLLDRLTREGVTDLLTEEERGSRLMSTAIEMYCRQLCTGLSVGTIPAGGFVGPETRFEATVRGGDGGQTGYLPLRVEWVNGGNERVTLQIASSAATSSADGRLSIDFPAEESFRNTGIRLRVSTDFARWSESAALADIDAASAVEATFRHFDDVDAFFSREVLVPGGPFAAGAVPQDAWATRKETPREAITSTFYIDLHPVTNALYRIYLEDTGTEVFPAYWDNPRFNQPDQPVVGVSYEEAVRFASWLSGQLGVVKRLPTEDEWEKAARGGREVIFPWGDQSPSDGARANYDGNGRFDATSPVGSYEEGKNAYGIFDMAGNVWEWTSTRQENGSLIAKGGSWMDGPADLRISNRREIDPSRGYADVGIRLIREVHNE
jgi:hypothetical protein